MDRTTEDTTRRLEQLPEHESDADVADTSGGGILGEGGTAVDRGTGTLAGQAQGQDEEDADAAPDDDRDLELDQGTIAYGAAARGSVPGGPTGVLPEAGFVPEQEGAEPER